MPGEDASVDDEDGDARSSRRELEAERFSLLLLPLSSSFSRGARGKRAGRGARGRRAASGGSRKGKKRSVFSFERRPAEEEEKRRRFAAAPPPPPPPPLPLSSSPLDRNGASPGHRGGRPQPRALFREPRRSRVRRGRGAEEDRAVEVAAAAGVGSSARGWGGVFAAASSVSSPDLSRLEPLAERGDVGVVGPGDELDDVGRGRRRRALSSLFFFPAVEAAAEEKTAADAARHRRGAPKRKRKEKPLPLSLPPPPPPRRPRSPPSRPGPRREAPAARAAARPGPPPGARHRKKNEKRGKVTDGDKKMDCFFKNGLNNSLSLPLPRSSPPSPPPRPSQALAFAPATTDLFSTSPISCTPPSSSPPPTGPRSGTPRQARPRPRARAARRPGEASPYRHIIAADSTIAIGLATSWPAMSGADPWTGSKIPGPSSETDAEGSMPRLPVAIAAASERMSPKMLP